MVEDLRRHCFLIRITVELPYLVPFALFGPVRIIKNLPYKIYLHENSRNQILWCPQELFPFISNKSIIFSLFRVKIVFNDVKNC